MSVSFAYIFAIYVAIIIEVSTHTD